MLVCGSGKAVEHASESKCRLSFGIVSLPCLVTNVLCSTGDTPEVAGGTFSVSIPVMVLPPDLVKTSKMLLISHSVSVSISDRMFSADSSGSGSGDILVMNRLRSSLAKGSSEAMTGSLHLL